jgi:endonuclease YncB( thermonuclease family)
MRYIVKLFFRSLIGQLTRPQPRGYKPVQDINSGSATKRKAPSESEIREIIEDLPQAEVTYVIDGDTVIVAKGWSEITIRLDSIDCPEDGQHWGNIAAYGLIKLIGGKRVYFEDHGQDPYGRMLATIYVRHASEEKWVNVNERMVTLGHAWVLRKFYDHLPEDRQDKLNRLEKWARSKKVGLWSTPNPVPPWQWRSGGRV